MTTNLTTAREYLSNVHALLAATYHAARREDDGELMGFACESMHDAFEQLHPTPKRKAIRTPQIG